MKIAALYARVSSARQQRQETIASQVAALLDYAQAHDYQISPPHIYQDEGYSGASLDRPALDRLRDAVAAGEVEAVLILSPDRLARQFAYQYVVTEEFERAGCQVVFISHGFATTPAERMLQEMTGVFAEYERAQITERCRRGRLFHARPGHLWMPQAPYGYTYLPQTETCPGRLVINEAEAEVVRQMFRWLVDEQLSTYHITKRLNEAGIRTRQGNPRWAGGYVTNLLRNSVYTGTYYYNRRKQAKAQRRNLPGAGPAKKPQSSRVWRAKEEWIAVPVPAIIEQETWEMARHQLQLNRERAPRNNKVHDYLLKGLAVCGYCQLRMVGHAGTARRRRYLCSRKESLHVSLHPCPGRTVLADTLEEVVWQSVSALLRDPHLLVEHYQLRQVQDPSTPEQHEQQRLHRKLTTLQREEQRLIDAYQASVIDLADLKVRCERIAEERMRMEARLAALKQQQEETERQVSLTATLEEFCQNIRAALHTPSFATKQRILRLVVDQIVVADEQITIKHVVPLSDVRLQRQHYSADTPSPRTCGVAFA
jgi:site-specific DNA recombinase